ncbi:MAG: ATP-binding protein [Rhodospirillales bacterium]|nr:ATP-binding protein [Rhodospirillales bacterium]
MPATAAPPAILRLRHPSDDLARLYPWLEAAAAAQRVPHELLYGMHVALEEAVANAALHGFAPGAGGEIAVSLHRSADAATLVIEDTGRPFDPTAATPPARPAQLDEATPGGRGLVLLRHYCRDIRYARAGGRNQLALRFPLAPSLTR